MKILFVLEHFYPYIGGAEKLFYELSTSLAGQGHHICVVTTQHDKSLPVSETVQGVSVQRIPCHNRFLFTVLSLPMILRIAQDCDLIHTTSYNAAFPAWLAGKLKSKRVIITFHEVWGSLWWKLPFINVFQKTGFYAYEQMMLKLSFYKYVAVSDFTKRELEKAGIPRERIVRIYNGLAKKEFVHYIHQAPQQFTYTFFGRLGISKGLDILLPAAKAFSLLSPDTILKLIIPKQPVALFRKIKQLIDELELEEHIQFMHHLSKQQLYEEITHSSCVVIPSYSEGFCFAAAETIAMKVPLISSQKGALAEVVSGKYLAFDPLDSERLLAALVKAERGAWEEKPRKDFQLQETVAQYLKLYDL